MMTIFTNSKSMNQQIQNQQTFDAERKSGEGVLQFLKYQKIGPAARISSVNLLSSPIL
jgi:hypothetical protein